MILFFLFKGPGPVCFCVDFSDPRAIEPAAPAEKARIRSSSNRTGRCCVYITRMGKKNPEDDKNFCGGVAATTAFFASGKRRFPTVGTIPPRLSKIDHIPADLINRLPGLCVNGNTARGWSILHKLMRNFSWHASQ